SGVPLGTSSHSDRSISSGEFSTRHANESVSPAASRTTTKTAAVPITHLRIGGDLEEPDQLPSLRTHGKRTPVELADRLDAEHRVRHEELVACRELGRREVGLVGREPYPLRMLEHDAPHHAADAAACDARRHQRV